MFKKFLSLLFVSLFSVTASSETAVEKLFVTPDPAGVPDLTSRINEAETSIRATLFQLDQPAVVDALIAARHRNVKVALILDRQRLLDFSNRQVVKKLTASGVTIRQSSRGFSASHQNAFVIDRTLAIVMSMDLASNPKQTRDFGVLTQEQSVIDEINRVFEADWVNSHTGGKLTPIISAPNLVWGPVDADARLIKLLDSAVRTLDITVENLGLDDVSAALARAVKRHVLVRVILPMCDLSFDHFLNYPFLDDLVRKGVQVRVMPAPYSAATPYVHGKLILIDGASAYVGSTNFTGFSLLRARELGLVVRDETVLDKLNWVFNVDWNVSVVPPAVRIGICGVAAFEQF